MSLPSALYLSVEDKLPRAYFLTVTWSRMSLNQNEEKAKTSTPSSSLDDRGRWSTLWNPPNLSYTEKHCGTLILWRGGKTSIKIWFLRKKCMLQGLQKKKTMFVPPNWYKVPKVHFTLDFSEVVCAKWLEFRVELLKITPAGSYCSVWKHLLFHFFFRISRSSLWQSIHRFQV